MTIEQRGGRWRVIVDVGADPISHRRQRVTKTLPRRYVKPPRARSPGALLPDTHGVEMTYPQRTRAQQILAGEESATNAELIDLLRLYEERVRRTDKVIHELCLGLRMFMSAHDQLTDARREQEALLRAADQEAWTSCVDALARWREVRGWVPEEEWRRGW